MNEVLHIYHASTRKNDFTGAHDDYDIWLFDEFHLVEESGVSSEVGQSLMASSNNTLLRVLDGQQCRLDSQYGRVFTKHRNVPVITITNNPVRGLREQGPFHERFMRLFFKGRVPELRADRLIATFWGCI